MPTLNGLLVVVLSATCLSFAIQAGEPVAGPAQPDYSLLRLKGDGMKQDSFSLAIQAAARCLGREADYESVCCLSANAFAPALDLGENCTAWWQCEAVTGDKCMETVAGRLGLAARRLVFPDFKDEGSNSDDLVRFRKAMAPIIRQAKDAGGVVVCLNGWNHDSPHGFVPWCWAGIVMEALDDGTIRGACLNGRADNPLKWPGPMWALTAAKSTLTAEAADAVVLTQALARMRGTKPFEKDGKVVYGLAAMDAWIKHMSEVPGFCEPCQRKVKKGWTCAVSTAQTAIGGARTAASYLRKRLASLPEAARPHVQAAAASYTRIVELLLPATAAKDGQHYSKFVGDIAQQKVYAEGVLKPARAELAAAADSLEKALACLKR